MKLISKYSQDIIRTPRSISMAACRHIIDISINLWRIGFVEHGENQSPGIRRESGRETKPHVQGENGTKLVVRIESGCMAV